MHATTQAEASCCLCWAWTIWWELQCKPRPATICARLAATWSELQCLPKLAAIAIVGFAILWVSLQCELRQVTCLKEPLAEQVGQNGSQGDTRVGWMILAKLMERERFYACLCQPAGWVERSTKEQLCLPELLSMGRVAPVLVYPTLALKLVNLVPPHISMLLLELLPLWWSLEQVSFCENLLRAASQSPEALSLSDLIPTVFKDSYYGNCFSQHRYPRLGSLLWVWDPSLFSGNLCTWASYPSHHLKGLLMVWDLLILHLRPSHLSQVNTTQLLPTKWLPETLPHLTHTLFEILSAAGTWPLLAPQTSRYKQVCRLAYILSYRNFVQLVFKWFSVVIVLQLSCSVDEIMEGGELRVYLLWPLDSASQKVLKNV